MVRKVAGDLLQKNNSSGVTLLKELLQIVVVKALFSEKYIVSSLEAAQFSKLSMKADISYSYTLAACFLI